jgi:excisionase family DNA binding protein
MPALKKQTRFEGNTLPEFLSIPGCAQLMGVSEASIRRFLTQKKLRRYKIGARTVVKRSDVLALAVPAEQTEQTAAR